MSKTTINSFLPFSITIFFNSLNQTVSQNVESKCNLLKKKFYMPTSTIQQCDITKNSILSQYIFLTICT